MDPLPRLVTTGNAITITGLVHRVRLPKGAGPHPTAVMIHGHLGNEDVMWIFARTLPPDWLIVSVRALYQVREGQYTWNERIESGWPKLPDFDEAVTAVTHFTKSLPALYDANSERTYAMGFSQGAATAVAAAIADRDLFQGIASLVGFVPGRVQAAISNAALLNLPIFMAAGERDETIPLEISRASAEAARKMGAFLEYREYDTGHKLNAQGMQKLKSWWEERAEIG